MIDLDAYCRRICYDGAREPTLATLRAIHALHPQAIAFENLDPLSGRPVPLDADALQQKMLREGRGGYCFEQNVLLGQVLIALGFGVRWLMARVRWGVPAGIVLPRTHMLLAVEAEGESYLADVGFGGNTLTGPLRLASRDAQATPHETFRLADDDGKIVVQVGINGSWESLYAFDLSEHLLPDLETANWFTATHPKSRFRNELIVSRVAPGRRYALRNNELAVHGRDGRSERRVLAGAPELRDVLADLFGLTLPADGAFDSVLARFGGAAQRAAE